MNYTKVITFFLLIFFTFSIPVNGEVLVDIFEGVNIYSDVNNSWDYSTRYEIQSMKEVESSTSYSISYSLGDCRDMYLQENLKPIQMHIDFDLNSGLKQIVAQTDYVATTGFIEGSSFNLMDGEVCIGYGSFFMWANSDLNDKLIYLYDFDSLDISSGVHHYNIVYSDDTIFSSLGVYNVGYNYGLKKGYVNPAGGGVYLRSTHHSYYKSSTNNWIHKYYLTDDMATINTITNHYISENDIFYHYNIDDYIGYTKIENKISSYRLGLTHNLTSSNTETLNDYYIFDDAYTDIDQTYNNQRNLGVKFDLYIDSTKNYPDYSFILDNGGDLENSGYYALIPEPEEPPDYTTNNLTEFDKIPYNERDLAYIIWNITEYIGLHADERFTLHVITSGDLHGNNYFSSYDMHDAFNNPRSIGYVSHQLYSLMNESVNGTITASIKYSYYDPVFHSGYIFDSYIHTDILSLNYTYVPPDPIDPPPNPDIPINDTPPEIPDPPPPPSGLNQTLNTSWSGEYYNLVDGMVSGLGNPLYNFTSWSLTPVTVLSDSINDYNVIMNESFTSASSDMIVMSESINVITEGFHPKIRNLITYYLVWLILLLILRKR